MLTAGFVWFVIGILGFKSGSQHPLNFRGIICLLIILFMTIVDDLIEGWIRIIFVFGSC